MSAAPDLVENEELVIIELTLNLKRRRKLSSLRLLGAHLGCVEDFILRDKMWQSCSRKNLGNALPPFREGKRETVQFPPPVSVEKSVVVELPPPETTRESLAVPCECLMLGRN